MGLCSGTQKVKKVEQQETKKDEQPLIYRRIRCPNHLGKMCEQFYILDLYWGAEVRDKNVANAKLRQGYLDVRFATTIYAQNAIIYQRNTLDFTALADMSNRNLGNHIFDVCKSNVDAAYSCRQCERDLCMKCKKESIDQFASVSQTCIKQHQKRKLIYEDSLMRCSQCNEFYCGFWCCKGCPFKRCLNCKFEIEEKS